MVEISPDRGGPDKHGRKARHSDLGQEAPGGSQRAGPMTLPSREFGPRRSPMRRSCSGDLYAPKVLQSSRACFGPGKILRSPRLSQRRTRGKTASLEEAEASGKGRAFSGMPVSTRGPGREGKARDRSQVPPEIPTTRAFDEDAAGIAVPVGAGGPEP